MAELWAIAAVDNLQVRVLSAGAPPYPRDVGRTPKLIVGDIHPDDVIQNISTQPIQLGSDRSLFLGAGLVVPGHSQWSIRGGVQPIWGSPHYYDRNPVSIALQFGATLNRNDGIVQLWLYTVPAGRRALLETGYVLTAILTDYPAPDPTKHLWTMLQVGALGGAGVHVLIAEINPTAGVIGASARTALGTSMELQPGETLGALAWDDRGAGVGSAWHNATAKLTEFDLG